MGTHINPRTARLKPSKHEPDPPPPKPAKAAVPAKVKETRQLLDQMRKKVIVIKNIPVYWGIETDAEDRSLVTRSWLV